MTTHFIALITPEPINKKVANIWLNTASEYLPNGIKSSSDIIVNGHLKQSNFYVKKFGKFGGYVIPLTRDLSIDEAGLISIAFSKIYNNGNFTVDFSQTNQSKIFKKILKENIFEEIAEQVAKRLQADYVTIKVNERWNYGPKFDRIQRKDPNLLPWEQLSESHKKIEIGKIRKMLQIIESIGFKIIRNQ